MPKLDPIAEKLFPPAQKQAKAETGLSLEIFSLQCPYSLPELLIPFCQIVDTNKILNTLLCRDLQHFESGWLQPPTLKPNIDKTFNICNVSHLNAKCCKSENGFTIFLIWYEGRFSPGGSLRGYL